MRVIGLVLSNTAFVLALAGCSSAMKSNTPETEPDVVISRIDDLQERPTWLIESEPFRIESGQVLSIGQTTIPLNHRLEAGYRIAENNARSAISHAIEQRLSFVFQQAQEGTELDTTQVKFIGAQASELTTSSIRPYKTYWEKVASTDDYGQRKTSYRIFSAVSMPEQDLKRAVLEAIRKAQGKGGISAEFRKQVDQHWDRFTAPQNTQETAVPTKAAQQ